MASESLLFVLWAVTSVFIIVDTAQRPRATLFDNILGHFFIAIHFVGPATIIVLINKIDKFLKAPKNRQLAPVGYKWAWTLAMFVVTLGDSLILADLFIGIDERNTSWTINVICSIWATVNSTFETLWTLLLYNQCFLLCYIAE